MGKYKHTLVVESDLDEKDFKRAVETIWLVNSFSPGKLINFKTRSLTLQPTSEPRTARYFEWIAEVCHLLGWGTKDGVDLVDDVSWFGCFDDGMSPSAAVEEAKTRGVLVSIGGKWFYQQRNFTEEVKPKVGGDRSHELTQAAGRRKRRRKVMHTTPEPMQKELTRTRESKKHSNVRKAEVPFESSKLLPRRRAGKIHRRRRYFEKDYGIQTGRSTPGYN